jgi:hypothetical protein
MDPDACYAIFCDGDASDDERADAAEDLLEWLGRGGFAPAAMPGEGLLDSYRRSCLRDTLRRYVRSVRAA